MVNFEQAVFDSLLDQVAILDHNGSILAVNRAWIDFAEQNDGNLALTGIGNSYLAVCPEEVKLGIIEVIEGASSSYIYEYPCHSAAELRWFILRVTPINLGEQAGNGALVSHVNITDRKLMEIELQRDEQRYRLIAENSTDFISIHTIEGEYLYVSPICRTLLGFDPQELVGQNPYTFFHPEDRARISSSHNSVQNQGHIQTITYRIRQKNGEYVWFETRSQTVRSEDRDYEEIICISRDVTKQQRKLMKLETEKERLQQTALTDELTGLLNRRFFNRQMNEEYRKYAEDGVPFALLIVDIDYFKKYNDSYGHQQGDECLIMVGAMLRAQTREQDFVCRIGGEEFCVLLPGTGKELALTIAERIGENIEAMRIPHTNSRASAFVTVSVGVSATPEKTSQSEVIDQSSLFLLADQALYRAKESGRNQVNDEG